ncbi:MAG: hypothetical protein AB2A00_10530 [Myxococcota bacterium]
MTLIGHGTQCDCAHHAHSCQKQPSRRGGLAAVLPVLGCAACPACVSLWKPVLSVLGVTAVVGEGGHDVLLLASLAIALGGGAWDLWRSGMHPPFWLTVAGAVLMLAGHALGEVPALEWLGMLTMLASIPVRMWLRPRHHHVVTAG